MKKFFICLFVILAAFVLPVVALAGDVNNPDAMQNYFQAAAVIVTAASALANLTPTETDNKIVGVVSKIVNFLAGNWFTFFRKK